MSYAEWKRADKLAKMDRYITAMLVKPRSERNPDISAATRADLGSSEASVRAAALSVVLRSAAERLAKWPAARRH